MTGVSAFYFFFTSTQSSQSRTPHSYTIMSQSITSMDARTQLKVEITYLEQFAIQQLYDSLTDMEFDLTAKQHSVFEKIRDAKGAGIPVYPEPEGCPSY